MSIWRRHLPPPDKLRENRWLRWLGPALFHPRLWHVHRRGIALRMALGVFFGLLIPIAQIPFSAAAAVAMRANVPAAVASTLVTNPVTFGPVYYAAWRVGSAILGEPVAGGARPPAPGATVAEPTAGRGWWQTLRLRVLGVGKPLLLGLAIFACGVGAATYFAVSLAWRWRVLRRRRLRLLRRPSAQRMA
jgi:hypothetical protein